MSCDKIANLRLLTKTLRLCGLWPISCNNSTYFGGYYRYYQLALHIPLVFAATLLMWIEAIFRGGDSVILLLSLAITETCLIIKILNIWHYAHATNELLHEWDSSDMLSLKTFAEQKLWQGPQRSFRRIVIIYTVLSLGSAWLAMSSVFFMKEISLPFSIWLPSSLRENPEWPIYLYEFVVVPFTCLCNTQLDMFLCYLSFHLMLCLRLIGMRMERLNAEMTDVEITNELENIIKLHHKVKCMSKSCEKIIMLPVLTQIVFSAFVICLSTYSFQNIHFSENPVTFLSFVEYSVVMSMQIFLLCYYANEVTIESQNLSTQLYKCDWTSMSVYNRRLIFNYMEYLKRPIVLYAGNYFEIGLPVFSKTMNNAYSLLALMANFNTKEN